MVDVHHTFVSSNLSKTDYNTHLQKCVEALIFLGTPLSYTHLLQLYSDAPPNEKNALGALQTSLWDHYTYPFPFPQEWRALLPENLRPLLETPDFDTLDQQSVVEAT